MLAKKISLLHISLLDRRAINGRILNSILIYRIGLFCVTLENMKGKVALSKTVL